VHAAAALKSTSGDVTRAQVSLRSGIVMPSRLLAALLVSAVLGFAPGVQAAANETDKLAARTFSEGQAAFKAGDFRLAAERFEAAWRLKPHHSPLWNAARSWEAAGEPARAANLYDRFLRDAPPGSKDRNRATTFLKQAGEKLGRLLLHAEGLTDLRVDKKPVEEGTIYVDPGEHLVEAHAGEATVSENARLVAGSTVSVFLKPPPPAAPPPPPPQVTEKPADATPTTSPRPALVTRAPEPERGVTHIVVPVVSAALALGAGGVTLWSGLDTLAQRDRFKTNPSQANLDTGRSMQLRTNVLIGVSAGLAALTVATAIILNLPDSSSSSAQLFVGPGGLAMRGVF